MGIRGCVLFLLLACQICCLDAFNTETAAVTLRGFVRSDAESFEESTGSEEKTFFGYVIRGNVIKAETGEVVSIMVSAPLKPSEAFTTSSRRNNGGRRNRERQSSRSGATRPETSSGVMYLCFMLVTNFDFADNATTGIMYKCSDRQSVYNNVRGNDIIKHESLGISLAENQGKSAKATSILPTDRMLTCGHLRAYNCSSNYKAEGTCYLSKTSTGRGDGSPSLLWQERKPCKARCTKTLIDLMFVVDGSHSIGKGNFEKVKTWIIDVASGFDISGTVQIGVVQYSQYLPSYPEARQPYIKTEIRMGQYKTLDSFADAVKQIKYQDSQTYTAHAITKVVRDDFAGGTSRYPNSSRIMLLLTDGKATDKDNLASAVKYAEANDVTSFAVGVGGFVEEELLLIAGSQKRMVTVGEFEELRGIVQRMQFGIQSLEGSNNPNSTNGLMQCQAGISSVISKNGRLYLGAVGAYDWSGTVTKYDTMDDTVADIPSYPEVQKVLPNRTKESYMGYSVTTGTFDDGKTEYVATGAPRYQLMGAVVIYRPINNNNKFNDHVRLMGHKSQRKLGSYFGGSVLALDINGDNKDDLLIGAPLYVHENYDEGRVFVYESFRGSKTLAEWAKDTYVPVELVGDNLAGGRFGTAMASAGDLNKDNYNDVIIGAPLADGDRGAVFVYHGSSNGIDPAFKQKILASQLSGVTLKYFGQSLQGGVDLDGNKYPDIAVGAPKSDTVVIFRSRPVVNIATEIKFLGDSVIDISNCIIDNSYINCSTIKVCFTATGESIEPSIGVKFNVSMDTTKAELDKRLEFRDQSALSSSPKFTWSMETNLAPKTEKCFSKKVNMKSNVKDYDSSVIAEVEYELTPQHTAEPMSSVRDPSKTNKASAWLNFTQNCDGPCDPNLGVTLSLDIPPYTTKTAPIKDLSENKTILVLDKSTTVSHLPVRVNLSNSGENAFGAKVRIKHTQMINYRNVRVIEENPRSGNSCIIKESSPEPENGLRTQILRFNSKTNIMPENSYCYFEVSLIMDPLRNDGSLDNFVVEVEAFVYDADGSSKDTNTDNNAQSQTTKLMYTSDMNLKELSIPDISFNHTTVPVRNITSIKEIGNNTDDIVIQFTILGRGYTNMPVVAATLDYPSKTSDNGTLLYLYKVECSNKNSGSQTTCTCDDNIINPHNLSMEAPGANSTDMNYITATRRNTAMEMFQYNCYNMSSSALCEKLKCNIRNLAESDEVVFKAFFRLFTDNLYFNENETNERLELRSRFEISSRPSPNIIDENGVKPIVKTGESVINARLYTTPVPPEPVANNLWIYIVAAIGGLLLLIVLVVILWKLGFFKSKYADLKKDAQDDVADETEFADQNGSK